MQLHVVLEENIAVIDVDDSLLTSAEEFFNKIDKDMDAGWQVSREFIENPDVRTRCQIVANRLHTAIENEQKDLATLLAAYILKNVPGVKTVQPDFSGELQNTAFLPNTPHIDSNDAPQAPVESPSADILSPAEASARARKEVSHVYENDGGFQFKYIDPMLGDWVESEVYSDQNTAQEDRMAMFRKRFDELQGNT